MIEVWSDEIVLVILPAETEISNKLNELLFFIADRKCHIVFDFNSIDVVSALLIRCLVQLSQSYSAKKHRLILASVASGAMNMFTTRRLTGNFEFAANTEVALASLETNNCPMGE